MKIVRIVLLVLLIAVVGVLAMAATKPTHYHIERSATISAAPAAVFAHVNDFHAWEAWSPWEKIDPAMKRTFEGPPNGMDATYAWVGNDKVGEGKMTIIESQPDARVGIRLEFIKPFAETCQADFALAPEGEGTKVTWGMDGNHNYVSKVMCVFMDMDKMIGTDFEKGLGQLKTLAESAPAAADPTGAGASTAGK
jgi:hypothetical protein